ncbi:MAG TPA: ferredoxin family protein [Candidatus Eisenbacteria bacterium]|nr:ferredoxin family protein [Candidatus Eisenbacteria bacterium]
MTYIIGQPCIGTKDTSCVDVCPVDCIHPRKDEEGFAEAEMLYIDPAECIDCGACEPACPVAAIGPDDAPIEGVSEEEWKRWLTINTDYYKERQK